MAGQGKMKLLLLGFDGLDFRLAFEPEMVNFNKLKESANYGVCRPEPDERLDLGCWAYTGPSWTSILTGLRVQTHGVVDLWGREGRLQKRLNQKSKSFSTVGYPYLWDYLIKVGYSVGVMNFPCTWPPPHLPKGSWFVSGWWRPGRFYTPTDLPLPDSYVGDYLDLVSDGQNWDDWLKPFGPEEALAKCTEVEATKLNALRSLPKVDCLLVQISLFDRVGHKSGKIEGEGRDKKAAALIKRAAKECDRLLGAFLAQCDAEIVGIVSDHGWALPAGDTHSENGVWLVASEKTAIMRADIMNFDFMPTFLAALDMVMAVDGMICYASRQDVEIVDKRLKALGYDA